LLLNTSVYTLAGFIAFARKDLDTAIERFDRAFALDKTNCEAVWTEGLVHVEKEAWAPAAPKFSTAMSCFTAAAAQARADIEAAQIARYAEAVKARRIAAAEKRLEASEHRKAQAAFNAAQSFVRLGEKSSALSHVDVAAEHVQLKEKATTLRMTIERMPR
jgi:tetratricopeptide (TPR) repeat protein